MVKKRLAESHSKEHGQMMVMFAFMLAVLCGLVALSIDTGIILLQRTNLQKTADAAALAGAAELPDDPDRAETVALNWAEANGFDPDNGYSISTTIADGGESITVEVARDTPFLFARALGLESIDVSADATAGVAQGASFSGVMPWAVLESAIQYDGSPTVLKYDSKNPTNGNFGALRLGGSGSKNYEENIKYGVDEPVCALSQPDCEDPTEETEPGNMVGGTGDGVDYRLDNTSLDCDEFDEVFTLDGVGGYEIQPDCDPFNGADDSLRVLLVPVIESFCNGHCTVTLQYFALVFLNDLEKCTGNSCEVSATFVAPIMDPPSELGIWGGSAGGGAVRLIE